MVWEGVSVPLYHKGDPMSFEVRKSHGPFFSWEAKFSSHQKVVDSPYFFKGINVTSYYYTPLKIGQNPKLERLVCKKPIHQFSGAFAASFRDSKLR